MGFVGATATDLPQLLGSAVGLAGDAVVSMYSRYKALTAEQRRSGYFYLFESDRHLRR